MASYQIPAPSKMKVSGELETNWKNVQEEYNDYEIATGLNEKDATVQVATLRSLMGSECRKRLANLHLTEDQAKDKKVVLESLAKEFTPKRNVLYDRYLFFKAEQLGNELIDDYISRLRHLIEPCRFGDLQDEMLRDRIVMGTSDKYTRARLFRKKAEEIDLKTVIEALQISETTEKQLKVVTGGDQPTVNYMKKNNPQWKKKQYMKKKEEKSQYERKKKESSHPSGKMMKDCRSCGGNHKKVKQMCPAFGQKCLQCGKFNHYKSMCWQRTRKLHQVDEDDQERDDEIEYTDDSDEAFLVEPIGKVSLEDNKKKIFVDLQIQDEEGIGEINVSCQVDTGAYSNIMSYRQLCVIDQTECPTLEKSKTQLRLYNGSLMPVKGERELTCRMNDQQWQLRFKIVEAEQRPLLSSETSFAMGLLKLGETLNQAQVQKHEIEKPEDIIEHYQETFKGLGCLPGPYHIEVDDTVKPVQHTPRRVPIPLKEKLRDKIDDLVKQGIIVKEDEPADWISSIVTILKPNKLRVCIDPRDLNKAKRDQKSRCQL
jgi:hypothetical protein